MYNRYIPQSDGSYQRNAVREQRPMPQNTNRRPNRPSPPPPPSPPQSQPKPKPEPVGSFLKQLIPKNFDTSDLIIVLLLLLLSGNNEEDRSTAMLTLALYLFM